MKKYIYCGLILLFFFGCNTKENVRDEEQSLSEFNDVELVEIINEKAYKDIDNTNEIIENFGKTLSGSWKFTFDEIDGERSVSWGNIPISQSYYLIVDLVNNNRVIILGASEGGKIGFDRIYAELQRIDLVENNVFRFFYKDSLDLLHPDKISSLVIEYIPLEDSIQFLELYDATIDDPNRLIRVSERLE